MEAKYINTLKYTNTLNKVVGEALVYTQAHMFPQVQAKSVTYTLSDIKAETPVETLTDASRSDGTDTKRHTVQYRGRGTC